MKVKVVFCLGLRIREEDEETKGEGSTGFISLLNYKVSRVGWHAGVQARYDNIRNEESKES